MKMKLKKNRFGIIALLILYIVYVFGLFWFHPFVACAAETDATKKNVPGGKGNKVVFDSLTKKKDSSVHVSETLQAKDNAEIVAVLLPMGDPVSFYQLSLKLVLSDGSIGGVAKNFLEDCTGISLSYKDGELIKQTAYTMDFFTTSCDYKNVTVEDQTITCTISGCKIFVDGDGLKAYAQTGSLDGMLKEAELDKTWYLKDIRCKVTADDSPSGSGGEEATYIKFFWLTDNLEEGDLIEVKSHNYVKKIGGDKISGFHDFITKDNRISALGNLFNDSAGNERASWTAGQRDAVKAWFANLESKPLIFKTYETDVYYFRPYRNGKVGAWCKVTMNRFGDSGSPYIEDVEIGDLDDEGDWSRDDEETENNGGNHGSDQDGNVTTPDPDNPFEGTNIAGIFNYLFDFFKSLPSLLGDLPALVNSILGFLPLPVIAFIAAGILIAIVLRIAGR